MRSDLILQPFAHDDCLVEVLQAAFANPVYDSLAVAVAWARPSGLQHIASDLAAFQARGGTAEVLVGIDEGGASVEGLNMVATMFNKARVLFDSAGGTFHPKVYVFRGSGEALVIVGSNNLTAGGLYYNYEVSFVVTLDLGLTADALTLEELDDYLERLREDPTCIELTEDVVKTLAADPRYRVTKESERRRPSPKEDSVVGSIGDQSSPSLFGATQHKRKAFKRAASGPKPATGEHIGSVALASSSSVAGGSTATVVARWSKKLTPSDCGQPRPGSNTTAALRFTKAGHPIVHATWFRQALFSDADWIDDPTRDGRERAPVRFDIEIDGTKFGTHVLHLKYDDTRGSGQHNFTTDLKWGSLTQAVIAHDLVDKYCVIERLADGTFRLIVQHQPVDFLDDVTTSGD